MSWLSKWWRSGGREVVRDGLLDAASDEVKKGILVRLRLLLSILDSLNTAEIRQELIRAIEYVEGM